MVGAANVNAKRNCASRANDLMHSSRRPRAEKPIQHRPESSVLSAANMVGPAFERIKRDRCTPFLGAGASFPALPLASTIAAAWAREYSAAYKACLKELRSSNESHIPGSHGFPDATF